MSITIPVVASPSGAKSTVTLSDPVVNATSQTFNVGETTILTTADTGNGNQVDAMPITLTIPATLVSVSVYVATAAGQLYLGLYDATGPGGGPGNLKATTAVFTAVAGWNTKPVTTQVALPAGNYHVAFAPSSSSLVTRKDPGGLNRWLNRTAFGPLPATLSTMSGSSPNKIGMYATFSGVFPPPTISNISPNPAAAGPVTITGTNFTSGATVSFGGTNATNVSVLSTTQLTCTAPPHADGTVNVTVTTSAGTSAGFAFTYQASAPTAGPSPAYYAQWSRAFPAVDTFFPIGMFLMSADLTDVVGGYPTLAQAQAAAGINHIQGVSNSWINSSYFAAVRAAGITMMPEQPVGLQWLSANPGDAALISGWFLQDEADMQRTGPGVNTPLSAANLRNIYLQWRSTDPTRPIYQNFGGAFATGNTSFKLNDAGGWDTGSQDGDMQLYAKACDLISVDSYWYTSPYNDTHGAYKYGWNVDNTRMYVTNPAMPVGGFVETLSVSFPDRPDITPDEMEACIWMCIVHGARALLYFNKDTGANSSGNSDYGIWSTSYGNKPLAQAKINRMTAVNARIKSLAPVLNSPQLGPIIGGFTGRGTGGGQSQYGSGSEDPRGLVTTSSTGSIPVDVMVRKFGGKTYVFAQASGNDAHVLSGNTTATFTLLAGGSGTVAVRDENRNLTMTNGVWSDTFNPYQMHIYVI